MGNLQIREDSKPPTKGIHQNKEAEPYFGVIHMSH